MKLSQLDNFALHSIVKRTEAVLSAARGEQLRRGFKPIQLSETDITWAKENGRYHLVERPTRERLGNGWLLGDDDFSEFE